jgi:PAS domain S-box-containing protein
MSVIRESAMEKSKGNPNRSILRQRAEKRLSETRIEQQHLKNADLRKLIHELQVHQIELEMQNEELQRAQTELEDSRNKYSDLYDFAPVAYFTLDSIGLIVEVNITGSTLLGMERGCLIKRHFLDFIHPDYRTRFSTYIQGVLLQNRSQSDELLLICNEGSERWAFIESIPHRDPDGTVRSIRSNLVDITARKMLEKEHEKAEEALRESQERLSLAANATQIGMYDWNVLTGESLWTQQYETIFDYSTNTSHPYRDWADRVHPDDLPWIEEKLKLSMTEHNPFYAVYRIVKRDGNIHWIEETGQFSYDSDGRAFRMLGTVRDITERRQNEQERTRAEEELKKYRNHLEDLVALRTTELEEKNKELLEEIEGRKNAEGEKRKIESQLAQTQRIEALDRFAGGIAHDLNNLLYPIIINIEELLSDEPLDSSRHDILDLTLKAAYRQRDLVKKILSFGRRSDQILHSIKIKPLLEDSIDFLRSTLPSTIEISYQANEVSDLIMGDSTQIQQVIMNLFQNAADAMESNKGMIEVGIANTYLETIQAHRTLQAGDYVVITVRDTGQGMKPDVMNRVFEPFFTTKDVGKGTGMGLAVVHGIVKSHGGAITVESEYGKGALFTVYLPVTHTEGVSHISTTNNKPSVLHQERILLVDDEEIVLFSLQRSLRFSGYRVVALRNGPEALNLFSQKPDEFDLVITDLTMPGMTGVEFSQKILGIRPDIPIILCTGYNDAMNGEEAKSLGIRELILKPTGTKELKSAVSRALKN